jgi:hypothetical protein
MIAAAVKRKIKHGSGDTAAPLAPGEHVRRQLECPHHGCGWALAVEWWQGTEMTRMRGTGDTERLCQEHLETHLDPSLRKSLG